MAVDREPPRDVGRIWISSLSSIQSVSSGTQMSRLFLDRRTLDFVAFNVYSLNKMNVDAAQGYGGRRPVKSVLRA